jgi:flavin-dependent dehydrogenase
MCGDSAGLITPLCGNGMSMAIHAGRIVSDVIIGADTCTPSAAQREQLEKIYRREWQRTFSRRLFWGRTIQKMFGNKTLTGIGINTIHAFPPLERWLISQTHGQPIL